MHSHTSSEILPATALCEHWCAMVDRIYQDSAVSEGQCHEMCRCGEEDAT